MERIFDETLFRSPLSLSLSLSLRCPLSAAASPTDLSSSPHPPPLLLLLSAAGQARFTVLTDNVIRMEYSNSGRFEERATLAILNRNLPVPKFSTSSSGGQLTITTGTACFELQSRRP